MAQQLIVAIFPSRTGLTKALNSVVRIEGLDVQRAAIVAKAASGETVIIDDKISADEGGITGGTLGAAMTALGLVQLGALTLPGVGPIIALGAGVLVGGLVGNATGRFAANLLESGFKTFQIEDLETNLQEGNPALVLEVTGDSSVLARLRQDLAAFGAQVVERPGKTGTLTQHP